MWAGPSPGTLGWADLGPTNPFLFLLGSGRTQMVWPRPAWLLARPSNLVSSNGGAALLDTGAPKWRPGWLRRGGADVRTVAEAVVEMVACCRAR